MDGMHRKWAKMLYGTHSFVWGTHRVPCTHYCLFLDGSLRKAMFKLRTSSNKDVLISLYLVIFTRPYKFYLHSHIINKNWSFPLCNRFAYSVKSTDPLQNPVALLNDYQITFFVSWTKISNRVAICFTSPKPTASCLPNVGAHLSIWSQPIKG